MKVHRALWVVLLLLALHPASAESQAQTQPDPTLLSVQGERSPVAAGILEWFVPTAGFGYAGDWSRGIWPNALRLGGTVLFFTTLFEDSTLFSDEWECGAACKTGLVISAVGGIWAIAGAVDATHDFNNQLRAAASRVSLSPLPGGGFFVGLKFRR